MKKFALVTGASAGIGESYALCLAKLGIDLVIVARREERLLALKAKLSQLVEVHTFPADLSLFQDRMKLYEFTKGRGIFISVLVNNAGFGSFGAFTEQDPSAQLDMIELNCKALVHLSHLYLEDMIKNENGRIINIASVAAFQPLPLMSVYAATKSFVYSYSRALSEELRETSVTVSAHCPGPTVSEFGKVASFNQRVNSLPGMSAEAVALQGVGLVTNPRPTLISGWYNKLFIGLGSFCPDWIKVKLAALVLRDKTPKKPLVTKNQDIKSCEQNRSVG